MPAPTLARDFYDRIVTAPDPVEAIRNLIDLTVPTFETDWLDFKGDPGDPKRPDLKQRDRKVRELWSEAIGGFANNQGGVLVWGIDARKIDTPHGEIDAASGDKPVDNPIALKSRLIELQRGATDPPLANVLVEAYVIPGSPSRGYVVCYVPQGPFKPYRSEQPGPQYYLRAGDNTVVMSRPVLASMFYPTHPCTVSLGGGIVMGLARSDR
jgi:Putative DNA-binding domain